MNAIGAGDAITVNNPASVTADNPTLILNITATDGTGSGYLKAYPSSVTPDGTEVLSYAASQTVANLALVNTATGNALTVTNAAAEPVQVVVDTNGYFA